MVRQLVAGSCALIASMIAGTTQAQVIRLACETTYTEDFGRHGSQTYFTNDLWVIDTGARAATRNYNERSVYMDPSGHEKRETYSPLTIEFRLSSLSEFQYELTSESATRTVIISRIDGSMSAPGRGADSGADRVEFSGRCQRYEGPVL